MMNNHLSPSFGSTSSLRRATSQISKSYEQAASLFLTRRLPESLSTLKPLVTSPNLGEEGASDDGIPEPAPIAGASRSSRVKVWSLYLTLLNSIIELGPEDGKAQFGGDVWKRIASNVRDGTIWEEVVQIGYGGVEGNVDAEVVSNLATLLLAHSPSQKTNQQRLESFLSASPNITLDDANHYDLSHEDDNSATSRSSHLDPTGNPRDLASRKKILEIYTIHVLPRNDEWDYAREFISLSDILDDESREAFLRSLALLQDVKAKHDDQEQNLQRERDQDLERKRHDSEPKQVEEVPTRYQPPQAASPASHHHYQSQRTNSEKGHGIDSPKPTPTEPSHSPPSKPSRYHPSKKQSVTMGVYQQGLALMRAIQHRMSKHPLSILRFVFFLLGMIIALNRQGVRARLRRLTGQGWEKIRRTVGMGVKVSYM